MRIKCVVAWLLAMGLFCQLCAAEPPRTTAETSDYQATSTFAEVVAFGEELARQSPRVRRASDWTVCGVNSSLKRA